VNHKNQCLKGYTNQGFEYQGDTPVSQLEIYQRENVQILYDPRKDMIFCSRIVKE